MRKSVTDPVKSLKKCGTDILFMTSVYSYIFRGLLYYNMTLVNIIERFSLKFLNMEGVIHLRFTMWV